MKRALLNILIFLLCCFPMAVSAATVTFEENVPPTAYTGVGDGAYYNGSDNGGGFSSGDAWFTNNYNSSYGSWDGFAYSNTTDTTTEGMINQFSAYTGSGVNGSQTYGISYVNSWTTRRPTVSFGAVTGEDYNTTISGMYVANTTYAASSMLNGDSFAKQFGGVAGTDEDWFKLTITGITETGYTHSVDFYLADYRFADNNQDYIVDEWSWVDLSSLGNVVGLEFNLTSSDAGDWGMNTPAYFAIDNLNGAAPVPVPSALWLLASGLLGMTSYRRIKA